MKIKASKSLYKAAWACFSLCLMLSCLPPEAVGQMAVRERNRRSGEAAAILSRYDVKKGYESMFRKVLKNYVARALASKHNIMVEAYAEQEQPSVMWIIERWDSKDQFDRFRKTQPLDVEAEKALLTAPKTMFVKDLEPVSKQQWRAVAARADSPLVIMLFVEAKPGTGHTFREIYHEAMPQFRTEPGVINYQLSQLEDDSTQFVTYEKFRSEAAFQYHLNFPPIQPVIDYLNTSIRKQPFQIGLHRLTPFTTNH